MNIQRMIDRFLRWKLPQDFCPDSFISFDREKHDAWGGYPNSWPTGTNLLTAEQARKLFEFLVESPVAGMTFGEALVAMKAGKKLARVGWNGRGMFVYLVPPASYPVQTGAAKSHFGEGSMVPYNAYMAIKNADNSVSTWVPSVNDCLAEDWMVIE